MPRTAIVAGATGLVGSALLKQLVARKDYSENRVLGRRPPSLEAGKIRFVATDFTRLDALAADLAVDDVFCCLGTTIRKAGSQAAFERVDYHMVVDLARAAKKAGAMRFIVVSAIGSSLKSPAFYPRVKARMEQAVKEVPFESVQIVQPSLLLGRRDEFRPTEWLSQVLSPLLGLFMIGPLKKYRPISGEAVAAAMIELALRGKAGAHVHHLPL